MSDTPVVERVNSAVFTLSTDAPEADGTLSWDSTTLVLATVRCDDVTGLGYTYAPAATARVIDDLLAEVVVGAPAFDVPRVNEAMHRQVRNAGLPGVAAQAIAAVDIALWDLKARLLGLPLVRLLGAARADVAIYSSGGFTTYDEARQERQLRGGVEETGIPRVKIKIAESWGRCEKRDRQRVARARATVGGATELYVDANGGYGAKQAVRIGRALADEGVTWFEEPVSSDHLDTLSTIRDQVPQDVTAGEYGYTLPYFEHMLAARAVDCLQADATRCGGITVWCASPPSPRPAASRSPRIAPRRRMRMRPPPCPMCDTSNGSTTTSASSASSSTVFSTPQAAASPQAPTAHPVWD